jgi:hypothetical protein
VNKEDWKAFLRWLETASDKELETKLLKIDAWSASFRDEGAKADARKMVLEINVELDARRSIR